MYHTTGFTKATILGFCEMVRQETASAAENSWPPILGLFNSVVVTLTYLRRNRSQADLGESYGVSQPTVSRAIAALTPLLGKVVADHVPVAEDLDPREGYIVDGTLLPCWSWHDHQELYSGKHKSTGLNVQVACNQRGRLAWISDPISGNRHDSAALAATGVLDTLDPKNWMGDKGYIGSGMVTPMRKPAHRDLHDSEREYNTSINRIRYQIERAIAHLKNWKILHTDYRRPFATFAGTISTVVALHFYALNTE